MMGRRKRLQRDPPELKIQNFLKPGLNFGAISAAYDCTEGIPELLERQSHIRLAGSKIQGF